MPKRPCICPGCHQTFASKYNLQRHQARKPECRNPVPDTPDLFRTLPLYQSCDCPFCHSTFATPSSMRRHARHACPAHRAIVTAQANSLHRGIQRIACYLATPDATLEHTRELVSELMEANNIADISCP